MGSITGLGRDLPLGFYSHPGGNDLPNYQPKSTNYQVTTGLMAANPYFMERGRPDDFSLWWEGFKARITTGEGVFESAKLIVGLNIGMRIAMKGILALVTRGLAVRSPKAAHWISNSLACALISGAMTCYQRSKDPSAGQKSFLKQWAVSFASSFPSMLLGMRIMPKFGLRPTIGQDASLEIPQALVAVVTGYLLETVGARDEMRMGFGERALMELTEGLFFMGAGHAVGATVDLATAVPLPEIRARGQNPTGIVPGKPGGFRSWLPFGGLYTLRSGRESTRIRTPGPKAMVLAAENLVASIDERNNLRWKEVELPDLPPGAKELHGKIVHVVGQKKLNGQFWQEPVERGTKVIDPSKTPLRDEFVQVQAYYYLSKAVHRLEELGFKVKEIHGSIHNGRVHEILVKVNAFKEGNAYFDPANDYLAFGIHIGADGDVVVHEFGHSLLHHADPRLVSEFGDEAGAIHEGTGDALATLIHNDPHLGEYFAALVLGEKPRHDSGLRRVDHHLKLSDVGDEAHDRGQVYGGFWWSLERRFVENLGLTELEANSLDLKLLVNHAFNYPTATPAPKDFVDAVLRGARGVERAGFLPRSMDAITKEIIEEAKAREFLPAVEPPPAPPPQVPSTSPWYTRFYNGTLEYYRELLLPPLFRKLSSAPFVGGKAVYYQQDHSTPYGRVEVVGHGSTDWYDSGGKPVETAYRDKRNIRSGEISHQVDVRFGEALDVVGDRLRTELSRLHDLIEEIRGRGQLSELADDEVEDAYIAAKKSQILGLALEYLEKNPHQIPRDLVVYREDNHLSYWIDLGYATFLVPANRTAFREQQLAQWGMGIFDCAY